MKLLNGPVSFYGAKVRIAAAEKGIALEVEDVAFDLRKSPPYLGHPEVDRINPQRQVPVLIDEGLEIFDSTLIQEYFEDLYPEPALWPSEPRNRAAARLIELKIDEVWFPKVLKARDYLRSPPSPEADAARAAALAVYPQIEAVLGDRSYLDGPFTYADPAAWLLLLFGDLLGV
ncbi:MAG TPA: glutathione S-transferase family protein, partial [Phenylobacterium sp.]